MTSSSSATGCSTTPAGTGHPRRRRCPRTSSRGPARSTSRPTSDSPARRSPADRVAAVAKVVVDVMLKPEILDPQGQAIQRALPSLGFDRVATVRQGKHFELDIDGDDPARAAEEVARTLLANPVIEDLTVRLAD